MSAQPHCTGPCHVYYAGPTGGPAYLGTGERGPRIRSARHFSPVMNDIGGSMVPFDVTYQGHDANVFIRLTRWNYGNLLAAFDALFAGDGGEDDQTAIGTLMLTEGKIGQLWLTFPYAERMDGMPGGYHFLAAMLDTDESQVGTEAEYVDLAWHCIRKYQGGKFTLYDTDFAGLPAAE